MRRRQGTDRVARVAPRQDVPLEAIDVADERIETPEEVAATGAPSCLAGALLSMHELQNGPDGPLGRGQ